MALPDHPISAILVLLAVFTCEDFSFFRGPRYALHSGVKGLPQFQYQEASTVSRKPMALVTATNVDNRGFPRGDSAL